MHQPELPLPPSYLKYAFKDQHNLISLLGAACFSLAFASPLPVLLAAAAEFLWLALGSHLAPFRRSVDRRLEMQRRAAAEDVLAATRARLPPTEQRRFLSVSNSAESVLALARTRRGIPAAEIERGERGLHQVLHIFLDYQLLSRRVTALIEVRPVAALEQEAAALQQSYAADKDLSVRMTIRKALTQNQRQIAQLQQLTSVARTIEVRLSMIEKALGYLKGQVADSASNPLARELDDLLAEVGSAEHLEAAVNEALSGHGQG
jgi:hypothetical protein